MCGAHVHFTLCYMLVVYLRCYTLCQSVSMKNSKEMDCMWQNWSSMFQIRRIVSILMLSCISKVLLWAKPIFTPCISGRANALCGKLSERLTDRHTARLRWIVWSPLGYLVHAIVDHYFILLELSRRPFLMKLLRLSQKI